MKFKVGKLLHKKARRSRKGRHEGIHLLAAAAGHEPYAVGNGGDVPYALVIHKIHQRVAHVRHIHAVGTVEIHLKGKNGEDAPDVFLQEFYAARAPRPHLGRNEVVHGNAERVGYFRHAEVELRRVDEQHGVGPHARHFPAYAAQKAEDARQAGDDLHDAHDGKFFHAQQVFLSRAGKVVAAHAHHAKVAFRSDVAQGGKQRAALKVAGNFTGIDPQCFHGNPRFRFRQSAGGQDRRR